ncbi:MAG: hypothetical protein WBC91_06340 [Phototrophicaceae bacterium]
MDKNVSIALVVSWLAYLAVVVFMTDVIGAAVIPVAAIMMVPLIVMMNLMLGGNKKKSKLAGMQSASSTEKRKRQRIDSMIRDMSDDELFELRQRLSDGSLDEDVMYERFVGDDGELMRK